MNSGIQNFKLSMKKRIDKRVEFILSKAKEVKTYIDSLPNDEIGSEEDRIWLDQFVKGYGFDICCGDFLLGEQFLAVGIDGDRRALGVDFFADGESLGFQNNDSLDFIVTNYFDVFPSPLRVLKEWHRVLKPGGVLAIVCRNADLFEDEIGPLSNWKRQSSYTEKTLKNYLARTEFKNIIINKGKTSLRSVAIK